MPSYVVTGAGKGLGYEFIRQFSAIPDAQVFGLVRDVPAAEQKVKEAGLENVHILQGDITDRDALKAAAAKVAETVPGVDYLINNAAYLDANTAFTALSDFDGKEDVLDYALNQTFQVNVVGVINTINAFLPLVRKSAVKKVITISSGMGDEVEAAKYSLFEGAPYSISKAAVNMVTAKYSAKHADEGILFLSLAPGMIATNNEAARESFLFPKYPKPGGATHG